MSSKPWQNRTIELKIVWGGDDCAWNDFVKKHPGIHAVEACIDTGDTSTGSNSWRMRGSIIQKWAHNKSYTLNVHDEFEFVV
jgi:hypothetical protein